MVEDHADESESEKKNPTTKATAFVERSCEVDNNSCIEKCVYGSAFVQIEFIMVSGCALIRR